MNDLTGVEIIGKKYRKTATITAVQIRHPFSVMSREGKLSGRTGDWLVEGIEGERWIIDNTIFQKTYEPIVEEE